jgi:hypothetical protein
MPKARIKGKLPIEIVVRVDERHHTFVRKPRPHAYRRAYEAPVSARAVAVIRPAPIIIAMPLFLCTLSGKRQLHACRYQSACPSLDCFQIADHLPAPSSVLSIASETAMLRQLLPTGEPLPQLWNTGQRPAVAEIHLDPRARTFEAVALAGDWACHRHAGLAYVLEEHP